MQFPRAAETHTHHDKGHTPHTTAKQHTYHDMTHDDMHIVTHDAGTIPHKHKHIHDDTHTGRGQCGWRVRRV